MKMMAGDKKITGKVNLIPSRSSGDVYVVVP
jgi:hypothetical protein